MALPMHNPASIEIFSLEFVISFKVFDLKVTNILKSTGWEMEKSDLPWQHIFFYSGRCLSCRTINLPSFNGLCCKLAKIALFVKLLYYWVECMTLSRMHILHIFETQISLECRCLQTVNGVFILSCNSMGYT